VSEKRPKLTAYRRELLKRAARHTGLRIYRAREANAAEWLEQAGMLRSAIPGYGADFYITDQGRAALIQPSEKN
jgi:thiamine monophosphate synthase